MPWRPKQQDEQQLTKPDNNMTHIDLSLKMSVDSRVRYRFKPMLGTLLEECHFDRTELMCILIIHYKINQGKAIGRKLFHEVMSNMFNISSEEMSERIFSAIEIPSNPGIGPVVWAKLMSLFLRGTLDEKILYCFSVYDNLSVNYISKSEMVKLLKLLIIAKRQDVADYAADLSETLLRRFDRDRDGKVSFDDYSETVSENYELLQSFGKCLPDRETCYAFMTTFTSFVSTMHHNFLQERYTMSDYEINVYQKKRFSRS